MKNLIDKNNKFKSKTDTEFGKRLHENMNRKFRKWKTNGD